jgi:hypothetical protein
MAMLRVGRRTRGEEREKKDKLTGRAHCMVMSIGELPKEHPQ